MEQKIELGTDKIFPFWKRAIDLIMVLIVILPVTILIILASFWILIIDGPPVIYKQSRVGIGLKLFNIYKLKTMLSNKSNQSSVTIKDDPRIIRGGHFLRSLKIDELPQLFNVIKGDMSLVGPRPTVEEDYQKMSDLQKKRALVPPGITGLAQVNGNTTLNWPERIKYDLEYVQKLSFLQDLKILLKTLFLLIANKAHTNPSKQDEWS